MPRYDAKNANLHRFNISGPIVMKILTLSKRLREIYPFDKEKIIKDRDLAKESDYFHLHIFPLPKRTENRYN